MVETYPSYTPPTSKLALFWGFSQMALQGFGGVMGVLQREFVENKKWLSKEELVELWGLAQVLPGPNVVNLSIIYGNKHFGWKGALAATTGLLLFPIILLVFLALVYKYISDVPQIAGVLRGISVVVVALVLVSGLKLMVVLKKNQMGLKFALTTTLLTFIAIGILRWPLSWVLLVAGGICWLRVWHIMSLQEKNIQNSTR